MSVISGAKVAALRQAALQQGVAVDQRALYDIERRVDEQNFRSHMNLLLGLGAACLGVYVYLRIAGLAREYPAAYEWWATSSGAPAAGTHPLVTVPKAALRVEFPAFYTLQTLAMTAETLPLAGAQFLLAMAGSFAKYMKPVHWNGSATQLRYADLDAFLPLDAKSGGTVNWTYVWTAFNAKTAGGESVNPWAGVLFASYEAMANSPAFQAYYGSPADRSYVRALYQGGLVEIAVTLGSTATTGDAMAEHLMGFQPGFTKVPCTSRVGKALQSSVEYGMYGAMAGGMGGHLFASRLAGRGRILPLLLTLAAAGGGAAKGATECKDRETSYSGQGAGTSI